MDKTGARDEHFLKADDAAKRRFWLRVNKTATCWLMKTTNNKGYGQFGYQWLMAPAHRIAKLWAEGKPMPGFFACHICEHKHCVRPSHTYWGTPADNSRDEKRSGRAFARCVRGERHGRALLTAEQVRKIWSIHAERRYSWAQIAEAFEISTGCLSYILRGKNWKHITEELPQTTRLHFKGFQKGSSHCGSKLSEEQVRQIKAALRAGEMQKRLAAQFGVSASALNAIAKGRAWKHV